MTLQTKTVQPLLTPVQSSEKLLLEVRRASHNNYRLQPAVPRRQACLWAGRCLHCGYIHHHGYISDPGDGLYGLASRVCHCSDYNIRGKYVGTHPMSSYFLIPDRTLPFPPEINPEHYATYLKTITQTKGLDMGEYVPALYPKR